MTLNLEDILRKGREQQERAERPNIEWFTLKKKNPVRVRFLQELNEDARNYDSTRGKVLFLNEHTSPRTFKRRAECTMDTEGQCFACEMVKEEPAPIVDGKEKKGAWIAKSNMYVWVATEDGELRVLSRPAPGPFFKLVYNFHNGDGENSITEQEFEISKGPNQSDPWNLMPRLKTSFELPDLSEMADLTSAVGRRIAYAEQKNFYIPVEKKEDSTSAPSAQRQETSFDW